MTTKLHFQSICTHTFQPEKVMVYHDYLIDQDDPNSFRIAEALRYLLKYKKWPKFKHRYDPGPSAQSAGWSWWVNWRYYDTLPAPGELGIRWWDYADSNHFFHTSFTSVHAALTWFIDRYHTMKYEGKIKGV